MPGFRFGFLFGLTAFFALPAWFRAMAHNGPGIKNPEFSEQIIAKGQTSAYPAGFMGSEFAFFFALFSYVAVSAIAARQLVLLVATMVHNPIDWRSPLGAARVIIGCLLLSLLISTFPDAVMLLVWGEVATRTIVSIAVIDRLMDGLVIVPFGAACLIGINRHSVIRSQLARQPIALDRLPTKQALRHHYVSLGLILAIAAGVTFGK